MKFWSILVACVAAGVLSSQETRETRPAESRKDLVTFVILHTNDVHGQIRPLPDPQVRGPDAPLRGGYQELVTAIDEERAAVPHSVLVDAGDWFQGTPEGTLSEGRCAVELMNAAGYDLAVLGNHEFDAGQQALTTLLNLARFRVVARNLRFERARPPFPDTRAFSVRDLAWHMMQFESGPAPIVTVGGMRIAFDGMLPEDTPAIVAVGLLDGLAFRGEIECARRIRESLDRPYPKAEALVLVNHIGKDKNLLIAREVPGIDVIIGGHNHFSVLEEGVTVPSTGTLIAQAAASTTALGIVTLEIDPKLKKIVSKRARLRRIVPIPGIRVPRIAPIIERYERSVAELMDVPVAEAAAPLTKHQDLENPSPLGNWISEVMRVRTGADIAVHNVTGVRASIPAGVVRVRELFQVSPFGNKLTVLAMKVADVKVLCERTLANPNGGLYFSGLTIHWAQREGDKPRVVRLSRGGHDLDDGATLQVATTDYLASGANNYTTFRNALARRDLDVTLFDASVEAARTQKTLRPPETNPFARSDAP